MMGVVRRRENGSYYITIPVALTCNLLVLIYDIASGVLSGPKTGDAFYHLFFAGVQGSFKTDAMVTNNYSYQLAVAHLTAT